MKVPIDWLKELVNSKVSIEELIRLIPLRTIGIKDVTADFIELDMKGYNRADLLSMRGVAYEIASISNSQVKFEEPDPSKFIWAGKSLPKQDVEVEDETLSPLYCLAKIENLKVEHSNDAWVKKLNESGIRSVNNIADVTNLVMLEYGQPLHAFDARAVKDEKIIVRTAKKGERITTLDGKTRDLQISDLLITDSQNILGIAGVMGGKNSEITHSTKTILLEAAIFDPVSIRKTSSRLKLTSEASKRFYHGLTKKRLPQALDATIKMYQSLGGKLTALTIVGNTLDLSKKVPLSLKKVNQLIGVSIHPEEVEEYLKKLHFNLASQGETLQSWEVTIPYWRLDINIEEDLVEEVARMYGYEKIPPKKLSGKIPHKIDQSQFELIYSVKKNLVELGLTEVQTYSFFSTQILDNLGWSENDNLKHLVKIANPISKETEYLRYTIWPNLVESTSFNLKRGFKNIAIFEIGKMYTAKKDGNPDEGYSLAILLTNNSINPLAELNQIFKRGLLSVIPAKAGIHGSSIGVEDDLKIEPTQVPLVVKHLFHPNRFLDIRLKEQKIGGLAEIHPRILEKFGIDKRVAVLEINLQRLLK